MDRPSTSPDTRADDRDEVHLPVAREEVRIRRETRETGRVRVHKQVQERTEHIDEPLIEEAVDVQRVPVNRIIDEPVTIRQEGDVTIIPIVEERLVVRKELVLKEEVHLRKHRTERREQHAVTLRTERAVVERDQPSADPAAGNP